MECRRQMDWAANGGEVGGVHGCYGGLRGVHVGREAVAVVLDE